MSYLGTNKIGKVYLGSTEIAKAYLGSTLVYENGPAVTNPYVTTDLVVHLDGIWNNGLGKHTGSTRTWVDISGNGNSGSANKSVTFTSTYADIVSGTSVSVNNLSVSGEKTIELVVSFTKRNTTYTAYGQWGNNKSWLGLSNYSCFLRKSNHSSQLMASTYYGSTAGVPVHMCLRFSSNKVELFGNLTSLKTVNSSDYPSLEFFDLNLQRASSGRANPGHVYALRVYDRALTDNEMSANYALDVQRFSL